MHDIEISKSEKTPQAGAASAPVTSDRTPRAKTNFAIEYLRVLSAFAIIWFHTPGTPFHQAAYSGLVCFLLISSYFYFTSALRYGPARFFSKKAPRLILPFAAWYLIFACLNIAMGKPPMPDYGSALAAITVGPWLGLWYLPFAFAASFPSYVVAKACENRLNAGAWSLSVLGASFLIAAFFLREFSTLGVPLAQWVHAAPAVPIGLSLAAGHLRSNGKRFCKADVLQQLPTLVVLLIVLPYDRGLALSYLIAIPLFSACLAFGARAPRCPPFLSEICLALYLLHPVALSGLNRAFQLETKPIVWFAAAAIASTCAALIIVRLPIARRIV